MPESLGRLRFPAESSRGRRYPEPAHPYRTEFQRDRDRVVHARAFRRLEHKTQVFTPGLSDHFRNRLTHTIEVAQISRTVGGVLGLDESLTEALALAHDIGHPPFAHAGEAELHRQMEAFGDEFDHNLHALRIVETFEQRYARFPGLNLTFEVREGIVKHSRDLDPQRDLSLAEYLPELRPPLEAQLIDFADEVAYNTGDLDDSYSAGLISFEEITERIPHYREIRESVEMQYPGAEERVQFHEALRLLIDYLVTGLIEGTAQAAGEAGVADSGDVRQHPSRLVRFTEPATETGSALKRLLHERVYDTEPLVAARLRFGRMIEELFTFYLEGPDRMPAPYPAMTAEVPVHRVVCDYIAGMTDSFFERTYSQLFGSGSR